MRNQQIFEANSGFKICLLRFHFSMFEAKTGLKFEAVFGLKNRVGLYTVFKRALGLFYSAPMEPTGNWQSLMPKVWCRMMVCWLQTEPIQPQSWKVTWLNQSFSCVCFGRMTCRSHSLELQGPMNRSRNFCRVLTLKLPSRKEASLWVVSMSSIGTL